MDRLVLATMAMLLPLALQAQTDARLGRRGQAMRLVPGTAIMQTNPATGMAYQSVGSPFITTPAATLQTGGTAIARAKTEGGIATKAPSTSTDGEEERDYPTRLAGYGMGTLHEGLNASMDLSVMAGFGKGSPRGAGFAQRLTATWLQPLGRRGWLTVGGYLDHLNWDGIHVTNGGIYGELGYQFSDHLSGYVYGQKSLTNSGISAYGSPYHYGYSPYGWGLAPYYGAIGSGTWGDRLGAALRWTPNENFSLQISVERDWMPKGRTGYFDLYNYPVPSVQ